MITNLVLFITALGLGLASLFFALGCGQIVGKFAARTSPTADDRKKLKIALALIAICFPMSVVLLLCIDPVGV